MNDYCSQAQRSQFVTDVYSTAYPGTGNPRPSTFVIFPSRPLHGEPKRRWPMPDRPDTWALMRASGLSAEGVPEIGASVLRLQSRPRLAHPGQDAMRDYETTLHGLAQYARDYDVLPLSRQLLQHYLDGGGEPVTIDPALLLGYQQVQDAERQNLHRFVKSLTGNINDYRFSQHRVIDSINRLNALRDGEETSWRDEWSNSFGGYDPVRLKAMLKNDSEFRNSKGNQGTPIGGESWQDLYLSLGKSNVKSVGDLRAKRIGELLQLSGVIDHSIDDRYDFELPQPIGLGGLAMEQYGGAKSFPIKSNWRTFLDGTVDLQLGRRVNPRIRFYREDELPRREE
jgi:hypothetical protein